MLQKARPTERLVELKGQSSNPGDTEGHKGKSPGASRVFYAAPIGLHSCEGSSEIEARTDGVCC